MWTPERDSNISAAVHVFSEGSAEWNATKDKCVGLQDW